MTQYDAFEQKLADSLRSDEMPAADFTARVMAQVAKTPQVKAVAPKKTWKIVLTAAACFAVVCVAVPLVFFGTMRAGSAAPAAASDCAAPAEAAPTYQESAAEEECVNDSALPQEMVTGSAAENGAIKQKSDTDNADNCTEVALSNTELCRQAREILGEMGLVSDSGTYVLTAEQGSALQEAMPELKLPAGDFVLILEG